MSNIILDPFTIMAEAGYPVGCRAKSKPEYGTPAWGTVVANNGQTFTVRWGRIEPVQDYDLESELCRHRRSVSEFEERLGNFSKDTIADALLCFAGSDNPGHAHRANGQSPDDRAVRACALDQQCRRLD